MHPNDIHNYHVGIFYTTDKNGDFLGMVDGIGFTTLVNCPSFTEAIRVLSTGCSWYRLQSHAGDSIRQHPEWDLKKALPEKKTPCFNSWT